MCDNMGDHLVGNVYIKVSGGTLYMHTVYMVHTVYAQFVNTVCICVHTVMC